MITGLRPYPAYRDSGVEWLGEMPTHWTLQRTKTLLQERSSTGFPDEPLLAATQTKGVVRKEQYENRTVLALKDLHLLKLVREGDFVVSLRSFQGGLEYARQQGIISPAYTVLYPRDGRNRAYLSRVFKSKPYIDNLRLFVTGIRQGQSIDYAKLSRSPLPCPPLTEQAAIARFLHYADQRIQRAITAKEKRIALLDEQKQAIIQQAVTGGLDAALDGPPAQWRRVTLRAATESIQTGPFGSQLHQSDYVRGGVPVVNPAHIASGRIDSSPDTAVTEAKASQLRQHRLRPGDVVMARRGEMGRCAVVTEEHEDWLCGTGSVRIRPDASVLVAPYLVSVLGSATGRRALTEVSIGTTMNNLSATAVGSVRLSLPPVGEQRAIADYLDETNTAAEAARRNIRKQTEHMKEYRAKLFADVVTGKLDVRDAAATLPDALPE